MRSRAAAVLFVLSAALGVPDHGAFAQQSVVPDGAGVVTSFSGITVDAASGARVLDPEGAVARIIDLTNPGFAANGSAWEAAPGLFDIMARDTGQVFGIAVDAAQPPNIYLAASSAFGLFRSPDNSGWMDGMWGPAGSPGTVYRLSPENGYRPEVFVDLTLDGRPNGGAGLGNIAYDATNDQLFVSDLENGLIFRVDAASGTVLDYYDHGIDGRAYYLDSASAAYQFSEVVAFDPGSAPRIRNCGEGPDEEAVKRFAGEPACWNFADFRRRVYGLAVHADPETGVPRLYYSVWGSQGFGDPDWTPASDDAKNTIWSIGLGEAGGFDLDTVRREFEVPAFFVADEDLQTHGASHPVTDIAFSEAGVMVTAERGGINGLDLAADGVAVAPRGARVLVFARDEDGTWAPQGRLDVGYDERSDLGPPYLRAAAAGGVALGAGYTRAGSIDTEAPDAVVWMTGDELCSPRAPCPTRDGTGRTPALVTGLQGTPLIAIADIAPEGAYDAAAAAGPVSPPVGPDLSYMIPLPPAPVPLSAGQVGDVEIYRSPPEPREPAQPVEAEVPDLGISKTVLAECGPTQLCRFRVSVLNAGSVRYDGPLLLSDDIGGGLTHSTADSGPFSCVGGGSHIACYAPDASLEPGERVTLDLAFRAPRGIATTPVRNCVAIEWLGVGGRDQLRAVQLELALRGFDPGLADGIMGPRTGSAIRQAERSFGLPETGELSPALRTALFGAQGGWYRDAVSTNNRACVDVDIDIPPLPPHWVQLSAFHRRFVSSLHDTRTSGPIEVHDRAVSSFHLRYRSSMHDGVTTRPIPYHRSRLSIFHRTWASSRHNPRTSWELSVHNTALSVFHITLGSGLHNLVTSLRIPDHYTRVSAFHRTHLSRQHDPRTTWERQVHRRAISVFHRTYWSGLHNPRTTREWDVHRQVLSRFHRTYRSGQHNPRTTREWGVHRQVISAFHRTHRSNLHDPRTTRERGVHNFTISDLHRTHSSGQHDPRTTRDRGGHRTTISFYHRNRSSAQHNPNTSRDRAAHRPALSNFHRTRQSVQHNPQTTRAKTVHGSALSTFHLSQQSAQHNPRTSQARPDHRQSLSTFHQSHRSAQHDIQTTRLKTVHRPALSNFHRTRQSAQHNPQTTRQRSAHQAALSTFHRSYQSAQHNPRTTRKQTVHSGALSTFHHSQQSAQHNPRTSQARPDHRQSLSTFHQSHSSARHNVQTTTLKTVHRPALSNFHRTRQSTQHNPQTTRQRSAHQAALSTFHRSYQSAQHNPRTTRKQTVHSGALSTFHHSQQSAQHNPRTSQARPDHRQSLSTFHQSHSSARHNVQTTTLKTAHRPALSNFHRNRQSAQHNPQTTRRR